MGATSLLLGILQLKLRYDEKNNRGREDKGHKWELGHHNLAHGKGCGKERGKHRITRIKGEKSVLVDHSRKLNGTIGALDWEEAGPLKSLYFYLCFLFFFFKLIVICKSILSLFDITLYQQRVNSGVITILVLVTCFLSCAFSIDQMFWLPFLDRLIIVLTYLFPNCVKPFSHITKVGQQGISFFWLIQLFFWLLHGLTFFTDGCRNCAVNCLILRFSLPQTMQKSMLCSLWGSICC